MHRYLFKLHMETQLTRQVTGYMARIMDDWGPGKKGLGLSKDLTVQTEAEITPAEIELLQHELLSSAREHGIEATRLEYCGEIMMEVEPDGP